MTAETNGPGREPTQATPRDLSTLRRALAGCPHCDYDEAEGGLVSHCAACQFKVTQAAWGLLVRRAVPPAPAPAPDANNSTAKMVADWLTAAKSCGSGIQQMVNVDAAEIIMLGLVHQIECDRIDLKDARGTIRRQRERIEQQARELADTRAALGAVDVRGPDGDGLVWIECAMPGVASGAVSLIGHSLAARVFVFWRDELLKPAQSVSTRETK